MILVIIDYNYNAMYFTKGLVLLYTFNE